MFQAKLIESLVALTDPADRLARARRLAELIGGKDLVIFCRDPEVGVQLPAPGFPQTFQGGIEWQEFLSRCSSQGEDEALLPNPLSGVRERWLGYASGADASIALQSDAEPSRAAVEALLQLVPIVIAAFGSERKALSDRATASSCMATADRAQNLATELDLVRRKLQGTLNQVRRSSYQTVFLSEASRRLSTSLDCETMVHQCGGILVSELADAAYIYLRERDNLVLSRAFADAIDRDEQEQLLETLRGQVERVQKTRDISEERTLRFQIVALPLCWRFQLNGILVVVRKTRDGRTFRQDEISLLRDFCLRLSVSLENSYLYRDTQLAVRAREEFLSIASHELKTPLTTILLGHQLIKRKLKADPQSQALLTSLSPLVDSVEEQLKNLGSLINTLLDVTRACQPNISLESSDFDLAELILKITERFREAARMTGSRIVAQADPAWVRCDQLRIEQAVNNLITNAIKYGAGRDIDVSVRERGGFASISVRDRGIGICPADQERIFNRFERAVDYKKISGLGLGLYITKHIVDAHGGSIGVQSERGKGSVFEIRIPLLTMARKSRLAGS